MSIFMYSTATAQNNDSAAILLEKVIIGKKKTPDLYKNAIPAQSLSAQSLQQLNTNSVGDVAAYFSGVLVKDYGGTGGLKTISVRGLGTASTGILYDGLPIANTQSGQIDLSRFSTTNVDKIELFQARLPDLLSPARSLSATSLLAISTSFTKLSRLEKPVLNAGVNVGSFGLWNPYASIKMPAGKRNIIGFNAEMLRSKGDYPFWVENGNLTEKLFRKNSATQSFNSEFNFASLFKDSSYLETKAALNIADRSLPDAAIFFDNSSSQRMWNDDYFVQTRYRKSVSGNMNFIVFGKYSYSWLRYINPDFLNNAGGINNKYEQQETYAGAALSKKWTPNFSVSLASDIAFAGLESNMEKFKKPNRISWWNAINAQWKNNRWEIAGSLLSTHINDKIAGGNAAKNIHQFSPTIWTSFKPVDGGPWLLRAFYQNSFRMPTFNDLYYRLLGNLNLKPEYAAQYNLGATYTSYFAHPHLSSVNISVDAYYNEIRDKIIAIPGQNLFVWTMVNKGRVIIKGVDIGAEGSGDLSQKIKWFFRGAFTFQNAKDYSNPQASDYKERIPYSPDVSGSAIASISYQSWKMGYNLLSSGMRYAPGGNNYANEMKEWFMHSAFLSKSFKVKDTKLLLHAGVNNFTNQLKKISNKNIEIVKGYPMPGISWQLGITLNH